MLFSVKNYIKSLKYQPFSFSWPLTFDLFLSCEISWIFLSRYLSHQLQFLPPCTQWSNISHFHLLIRLFPREFRLKRPQKANFASRNISFIMRQDVHPGHLGLSMHLFVTGFALRMRHAANQLALSDFWKTCNLSRFPSYPFCFHYIFNASFLKGSTLKSFFVSMMLNILVIKLRAACFDN